jgi:Cd2+/Zn2+-exporting ATPase
VDQSPVTGESAPVDKTPGSQAFAGTINGEGALEVRVTRLARDSTLARVMRLVEEAQAQKSPTQQTVERFSRVFVPAVLVAALLLIVVPPLFGVPFQESFLRAMTLLVAASPCALALGAPAAILAGVARAARGGVLVKGGVHLENLGRLKAIAFDKTGTITSGRPEVTDVVAVDGVWQIANGKWLMADGGAAMGAGQARSEAMEVLALAAAAESRSGHPLAQAVVRAAKAAMPGRPFLPVAEVESLTGRGLRARVDGRSVFIGSLKLLDENGVHVPADLRGRAEALESAGKTVTAVAVDGRAAGLLALADTLRPGVPETLAELRRLGVTETVMLTGDNARVARRTAQEAGIASYRADLLPEDKLNAIRELVEEYGQVAMVGDGVNDAPALANATVGIAMGGAATDVALETADVALMADDLGTLPFAVGIGRATRAVIQQNLAIALGVIGLLIVTSVFGLVGIGAAIILHEGSTIVVVLNALRLLTYRE